jgi:hypothetical protein
MSRFSSGEISPISAVNDIAPHYKARIYREFLGIEPPDDSQVDLK